MEGPVTAEQVMKFGRLREQLTDIFVGGQVSTQARDLSVPEVEHFTLTDEGWCPTFENPLDD